MYYDTGARSRWVHRIFAWCESVVIHARMHAPIRTGRGRRVQGTPMPLKVNARTREAP